MNKPHKTLVERGRDVSALWSVIVPGVTELSMEQALRWVARFSDVQIESAFHKLSFKMRKRGMLPEHAFKYVTGTLINVQREQAASTQQSSKQQPKVAVTQ